MKAARVNKQGGIEEIEVADIPVPSPKPDEIVIKTEWAGVNFSKPILRQVSPHHLYMVTQSTLISEGECILVLRRLPLDRRLPDRSSPCLALMTRECHCLNWLALLNRAHSEPARMITKFGGSKWELKLSL
jgi:hypothetical protein